MNSTSIIGAVPLSSASLSLLLFSRWYAAARHSVATIQTERQAIMVILAGIYWGADAPVNVNGPMMLPRENDMSKMPLMVIFLV